jgi:lauroyl/myristoyl acyltransferase
MGVEAVRLLRKGNPIGAVKATLGDRYGYPSKNVDLTPLLRSMVVKELILKIGERSVIAKLEPAFTRIWRSARNAIAATWIALAVRHAPLPLLLPLLYAARQGRASEMLARIETNLGRAVGLRLPSVQRQAVAAQNLDLVLRAHVDRLLLGALPVPRLRRWFEEYMMVCGTERLDDAIRAGKRIILCGFHTGSYILLPYLLAAKGYCLTALIRAGEAERETAEQIVARLASAGLGHDLRFCHGSLGIRSLSRALDAGRAALILPDALTANTRNGVVVDFLGLKLRPGAGLEWLCGSRQVEVLPVYLQTAPHACNRLVTGEAMPGCADDAEGTVTNRVFHVLEKVVSNAPTQWLRWKDLDALICN